MCDFIHTLPLWWARVGALILFIGVLAAAWLLPKEFIFNGAPDTSRWRDLRIWAALLVLAQCVLYAIF